MEFILSFYEKVAGAIYKTKIPLMGLGFIACFTGLVLFETGNKPSGFWLFIIGILSMGTRVFLFIIRPNRKHITSWPIYSQK
jgi:hypothetical protein